MLECWGGYFSGGLLNDLVKIGLMAEELGVTPKTIYNWIERGKLVMHRPGFVSQLESYEVWLQQRSYKSIYASEMARYGITRDANGRFITKSERERMDSGE